LVVVIRRLEKPDSAMYAAGSQRSGYSTSYFSI
jgi:hypothetical protein